MIDTGLVYCHVLSKYKSQEFILKDLTRQTLEHILVPPYQALRVIAGPPRVSLQNYSARNSAQKPAQLAWKSRVPIAASPLQGRRG